MLLSLLGRQVRAEQMHELENTSPAAVKLSASGGALPMAIVGSYAGFRMPRASRFDPTSAWRPFASIKILHAVSNAMFRRRVLRVSAITVLGLAVIPSSAIAQHRMLNEPGTATATPEARQSLAPSGKLRVGVYPGSPY
jgi:hypothetical protein